MAEMSMNRVIHGAVRRDLARFLDALESFSNGDRSRAEQLAAAWANFDDQLTRHHEGEQEIAWPALQTVGVSRQLIAQMDDEHDRLADALASAGNAALRTSASATDAAAAREAFATLKVVATEHLDHCCQGQRPRTGAGDYQWHLRPEVPPRRRPRLALGRWSGVRSHTMMA